MTINNKIRRSLAFHALTEYLNAKNEEPEEIKTCQVVDLITDLLHLAHHEHKDDPKIMCNAALFHLQEEIE